MKTFTVSGKVMTVAAVVAATVSGCSAMNPPVSDPMTPEEAKDQVVDAAREIVAMLDIDVVVARFWPASCNDQGEPPFRGVVKVFYPKAPSFEDEEREVAAMLDRLKEAGWQQNPNLHTHGSALQRDNVVADFGRQNVSQNYRDIRLMGECRDVTTPKGHYPPEEITVT